MKEIKNIFTCVPSLSKGSKESCISLSDVTTIHCKEWDSKAVSLTFKVKNLMI